jgi:hypothetical protein
MDGSDVVPRALQPASFRPLTLDPRGNAGARSRRVPIRTRFCSAGYFARFRERTSSAQV